MVVMDVGCYSLLLPFSPSVVPLLDNHKRPDSRKPIVVHCYFVTDLSIYQAISIRPAYLKKRKVNYRKN